MVAICIKYCYVLLINLYYIPDPPFLLHAILETALTHLRPLISTLSAKITLLLGQILDAVKKWGPISKISHILKI